MAGRGSARSRWSDCWTTRTPRPCWLHGGHLRL